MSKLGLNVLANKLDLVDEIITYGATLRQLLIVIVDYLVI